MWDGLEIPDIQSYFIKTEDPASGVTELSFHPDIINIIRD